MEQTFSVTADGRRKVAVLALIIPMLALLFLVLAGCAPEPTEGGSGTVLDETAATGNSASPSASPSTAAAENIPAAPVTQEESCGWESARLQADLPSLPTGQQGELSTALIGAWQHTHYNTGNGFETLDKDIRYIFPASDRLLYCQDVPGITDQASNAVDFVLDGTAIVLPGSAPGYVATDWNDQTMVWTNLMDNSTYILQRR